MYIRVICACYFDIKKRVVRFKYILKYQVKKANHWETMGRKAKGLKHVDLHEGSRLPQGIIDRFYEPC